MIINGIPIVKMRSCKRLLLINTDERGKMVESLEVFYKKAEAIAVVRRCCGKKVFLEVAQNSQENTIARVSFLIKMLASGL